MGMQNYVPDRKVAMMTAVQKLPGAGAGATHAVKQIALRREGFIPKVIRIVKNAFTI